MDVVSEDNVVGTELEAVRELRKLALTDAMNANRVNDTLRDALVGSLVEKVPDLEVTQILDIINALDNTDSLARYEKLMQLFSK